MFCGFDSVTGGNLTLDVTTSGFSQTTLSDAGLVASTYTKANSALS